MMEVSRKDTYFLPLRASARRMGAASNTEHVCTSISQGSVHAAGAREGAPASRSLIISRALLISTAP